MSKSLVNHCVIICVVISLCFACSKANLNPGSSGSGPLNWSQASALTTENVYQLVISGSNVFAGTSQGIFVSANSGGTWSPVNGGLPSGISVGELAASGSTLVAGTSAGPYYSTDGGTTWTATTSTDVVLPSALAIIGTSIFAGLPSGGVSVSGDNGTSWTAVNSGLPANGIVNDLVASGSNLFAAVVVENGGAPDTGTGIYLSTNNGSSWSAINSGLPQIPVMNCMAINGSHIYAGIAGFTSHGVIGGSGVYLSTNGGTSWSILNTGIPSAFTINSLATSGNDVFAGTAFDGVFLSTNNGSSWTAATKGLPTTVSVGCMVVIGQNTIAGDNFNSKGVYKTAF